MAARQLGSRFSHIPPQAQPLNYLRAHAQGVELAQERRKACTSLIEEGLAVLGGLPASRYCP